MKYIKGLLVFALMLIVYTTAHAELKLRVIAVNPSETEIKTTQVKIYLPKEVTPNNIIDLGGLNLEFDESKSIYYVYRKGVELNPRETKLFEVEIEDVWRISESELKSVTRRTDRILAQLEDTDYYAEAASMVDTIYERIDEVKEGQNDDAISRESHIGLYRSNLDVMKRIKQDVDKLEKLLIYTGGPPAPEMLEESSLKADAPTTTTTWFIIFLIIGFIGLLGFVFFYTWQKQSKTAQDAIYEAKKTSFPEFTEESSSEENVNEESDEQE